MYTVYTYVCAGIKYFFVINLQHDFAFKGKQNVLHWESRQRSDICCFRATIYRPYSEF